MATIDQATLERVLSGVNVGSGSTRRVELPASGVLPLADGVVSFVHVLAGTVRGHPPLSNGCSFGIDPATQTIRVTQPSTPDTLTSGGALLMLGDRSVILDAPDGASLAVGELQLTDPSSLQMMPISSSSITSPHSSPQPPRSRDSWEWTRALPWMCARAIP